jgi:hypothetical protein
VCGYQLKDWHQTSQQSRGRVSFELDAARTVKLPEFHEVELSYLIPVLFNGEETGLNIAVLSYSQPTAEKLLTQLGQFEDVKAVLRGALTRHWRQVRKV